VQGVWFRDSTRRVADELGITGHAINLDNGDVEVLAYGSPAALRKLANWLHEGPPMSSVAGVKESVVPWQELSGFRVG
jgi:acylphosphatase